MNKTEKEIVNQKELKTFRKAMYLVEREVLTGWRKTYLTVQGFVMFFISLLVIRLISGDGLSLGEQVVNLIAFVAAIGISYILYWSSKLFLKWSQLKKRSGYKVDFSFKREKSQESVKI